MKKKKYVWELTDDEYEEQNEAERQAETTAAENE